MSGAAPAPSVVRFGPYELDLRSAELRKHNLKIRLQDQPFQILVALLERPGELVLREEIRRRLWPDDTVVEFDHSINAAVKRLRDALRESAEKPRYIETLARRGYRFIGQLETASTPLTEAPVNPPAIALEFTNGASAGPVHGSVYCEHFREEPGSASIGWLRRARSFAPLLTVALLLAVLAIAWYYQRTAPTRWARNVALPQAARLADAGDYPAAFPLTYRGLHILPKDPALNRIMREISFPVPIHTTPSDARVYIKPYADPQSSWIYLGQSPLENFRLPIGYFRWRVTKAGFRTVERAAGLQGPSIDFTLDREASLPADMVHVPRGSVASFKFKPIYLDDFWVDTYEVTNKQFQHFMDAGGYRNRQFWREKFLKNGRMLSWEEAMAEFRDSTGRPGPSTWEVGHYPSGQDDFPVSGVSWFEAAAYAVFANKQLPTIHQWYRVANPGIYSDVVQFSNFDGSGPLRVGSRQGLGAFGTYDLAGNVKEWCWNATGNRRYILGGGWNEGRSFYLTADATSPFDRSLANGFRCAKNPGGPLPVALTQPVEDSSRDHRTEKPVPDSVFHILQRFYSYDRTELGAAQESVDESSPYWRAEKVSLNAAYDHQRLTVWLYLPRNAKPPYQTIIYFPAGAARIMRRIDQAEIHRIDFLMKSGRAVVFPIYQGTYGRRPLKPLGPSGERDEVIQQCKDLQRSVDYLETRTDVALDRIGYFGISTGARLGLIALVQDHRIRAATLAEGGLSSEWKPPEIDEINFAPRLRIPVLMLNGRYDFPHPVDTDQVPLFRLLGTSPKDKRRVLFDSGHAGPVQQYIRDTLDWFDKYLGVTSK
ncbi:MAG TPA: SUMF1/EgtB/PvdO family nonheme iron enzyme [Bryobacteraceae bacterium]|nr:SUMF1/EgtB/PvdO family nonheme iron enzyme [Bryobacteraceae bacterium]